MGPVGIRRPSAQQGGPAGLSPAGGDASHREGHHAYGATPSGLRKAFMGWGRGGAGQGRVSVTHRRIQQMSK